MRLAYLSTDPGIAYGGTKGAAIHVQQLVTALAADGAEVLLIVDSRVGDAPVSSGVEIDVLPRPPGKQATTAERLAAEPRRTAWLEERVGSFGADLLYERLALHSAAGSVAARALGIPHVVELNAPLPEEAARYRRLDHEIEAHRLERAVLTHAGLVLAVSRPLAAYAQARGAVRVAVLPNAVAPELFEHASRHDERPPVAVFAGSLRPWHGIETIAEAWRLLGADAPDLLVVGDGPGRLDLEEAGAQVTGAVPHADVPSLLAGAHIGLAPYAPDAPRYFSPLKVFEYLAAGLATVVADLPGVREVVTPDVAVLVPRGDASALADTVASLAADPARRARLGRAARSLVTAHHTWAHRARTIVELVDQLAPAGASA